ncbi:methyltransferase domain-containing protein [bacterium]|nr:methyltransferase domain-containing protein [bacterium]
MEIGPGENRIEGFETVNTLLINETDYIAQLGYKLPFNDNCFDVIYLSHVLEHVFWHKTAETIKELRRILKPNGQIEIWVPDGLKIAQAFCDAEHNINMDYMNDGWYKFNEDKDPCVWFSGRMFTYGDGRTPNANNHYNVHLSAFSYRYLYKLLQDNNFKDIQKMDNSECRGYNHGWINLGIKGTKTDS